ncbi:hypothetical protein [Halorubrum halophilum]|uniref:hypothetical protein n=1 Tax=Halorubrum halophilum TaxID=413816 RepID=UPI00186ACB62|nr:hypothetical protein [Halorubrum halophilum]
MARDEVIRVRVTADEKEEMREHIENELHYSGFSDYFRTGLYEDKNDETDDVEIDVEEIAEAVADELEPLKREMETLNEKLDMVMESVQESEDEVVELATELRELIPVIDEPPIFDYDDVLELRNKVTPESDLETVQKVSDAHSWSIYLDEPVQACERALTYLEKYYPSVVGVTTERRGDGVGILKDSIDRYFILSEKFHDTVHQAKLEDM